MREIHSSLIIERPSGPVDLDRRTCHLPPVAIYTPEEEEFFPHPHFARCAQVKRDLENDILPRISNGFSFVIDTRPEGKESQSIPDEEYTCYFSNRQIPMAGPGHRLFEHDIDHVPGYQDLFEHELFAEIVREAATNARESSELCRVFATSMDGFGDCMRDLNLYSRRRDVEGARQHLEQLIHLGTKYLSEDLLQGIGDQRLRDKLEEMLGITDWRARLA